MQWSKKAFNYILVILLLNCGIGTTGIYAQSKIIKGYIKDALNEERIPFASIEFINSKNGKLSDSAGNFIFHLPNWPADTLTVTYVGYQDYKFFISPEIAAQSATGDTLKIVISLERGKYASAVVVKRKIDRGYLMWKRIVKHKPANDRYRFDNFSYELYNKMELDLNRVNREKLKDMKLLKPFSFLLDNVDTTEGSPFLPIYLTESISDYYYQRSPFRTREVIKASKTMGVDNESVIKFLGGTDQNINVYSNFIPVFDKQFVSPFSDNGDAYYQYQVLDTQYVNHRRFIHFSFVPRRKGENTFEGDSWIHDTTFAVQKVILHLGKEANINFVEKLSLVQEYSLVNDSTWFLSKDKFVIDISPIGKTRFGVIGRKTATYHHQRYNEDAIIDSIKQNKIQQEVIVTKGARDKEGDFWENSRHEQLSKNEQSIYSMIDTLNKMPLFHKYTDIVTFLATGYTSIGNYDIGPWYNWISGNNLEGLRMRFDLSTNYHFNRNLLLHGYLAYGFKDRELKYKADAMYIFKRVPRLQVYASYLKDLENGQNYFGEITPDNIFALAIRKPDIPLKFMQVQEARVEVLKEWNSGFSITPVLLHKQYNPLQNLPPKSYYTSVETGEPLTTFEVSATFRFAYLEKFLETNFSRYSIGSPYPITEFKYTQGISGVFNSAYNYQKIYLNVYDYLKIPPYGSIYYSVYAGKTFGTLPYMMLDVMPGNEMYYYNKHAFNLMNKFEYVTDRFAGIQFEHNLGNALFRYIPLTRMLKFRQFYNVKLVTGDLSQANYNLNFGSPNNSFQSLNGRTYMEVGTGVDNIFKVFRLDFVWRVLPRPLPEDGVKRFGVFGSFRLTF